jgi:hypothetical protein
MSAIFDIGLALLVECLNFGDDVIDLGSVIWIHAEKVRLDELEKVKDEIGATGMFA